MNGGKGLWLTLGVCLAALGLAAGLSAVAAQGGASSPDLAAPHAQAPAINQPPMVGVQGGAVRAGESLSLAAYATDMESDAIHLGVLLDLHPGQSAPAWLERKVWTADLAAQPILRIPVSPPADAKPGTHSFLVGATDSGGLTSWRRMFLEVLPPAEPAPAAGASPASGGGAVAAGAPNAAAAPKPAFSKASPTASASDAPSLNLSVSPASMAEGSSGDVVVSATLLGAAMVAGMDVVGELQVSGTATDGTDYTLSGTRSVRIPADSATLTGTRTLRLSALADELRREGDETVMLRVAQVTRGTEVVPLSGAAEASVMVENVFEKPPKVSGVSAEAAKCGDSSCALRVSWDAPAASPPLTEQFVQHRREDKPNGWARMDVPASATAGSVTGLQPGRRHLVRVRVRNKAGRSEWSEAAMANTAPLVAASAENGGVAFLGEGGAKALIGLTGSAQARGGGTLTGRWFRVYPNPNHQQNEIVLPSGPAFAMESGRDHRKASSPASDSPESRLYRLEVTHELSGDRTVGSAEVSLLWLPKVVLSASPSSVAEDGGARTVRVEARLTGRSVSPLPKSVLVEVKDGTATGGADFTASSDFRISVPGGARSASGTFTLRPTADSVAEGGETVRLRGRASEGPHSLEVRGAEVVIEDDPVTLTVSPAPTNGKVTGPGIDCGAGSSGDCSEAVTKSGSASLTASPAAGYVFDEWSGACSSEQGASCTVVVSEATTVGASFRLPKLTVLVLPATGGSVSGTGIDCGFGTAGDCAESVSGGTIALTALPASGHAVRSWSGGGCSGTGRTCTAAVTADTTVTVAFMEQPAPSAPSGLAATIGDGRVTLSWTDPGNATITGYEVRHKAGTNAYGAWADISGSDANTTSHTVMGLANGTAHSFELRAENSTGAGASATVSATPSRTPSADAGADQRVSMGSVVTLDGSGSSEPDGETLAYAWHQTSGTTVALSDAAASAPTFRAPSDAASVSESLSFSLKVSDPHELSDTDGVTVTAENQAPAADAGDGQSVAKGATVTLDGSGGSDPEGGALTYVWSQTGRTTVTLSSTTTSQPTFTAPSSDGTLTFSLTATDPAGLADTDTVVVTVENQPPTALVPDQSVAKGATVTLDGSGSSDPENGALTYAWSQVGRTTVTLSSTTASKPTFTAPNADGTLTFSLTVTDPLGLTGTNTGTVTVENQAPLAVVPDQIVAKGATVTLDGSGSSDPENGALTYAWSQIGRPTVTLSSTTAPKPTFTAPNSDGTLTFSLTVTDPQGLSGADTGTVTVVSKYALTISPAPANGSVTGTGIACGAGTTGDCAELVDPGTSVELTATPAANYVVGGWSVAGCSDGAATCTVVMDAGKTVGVTFAKPVLTISPVPTNGSVTGTGIACGAGMTGDCSEAFNAGTKVTLTASPAANHAVKSWSGGSCSGDGGTCEVTVGANTTVGVTFGKPTLTVSPKPTRGYVTGNGISCGSGTGRTTCSVTLNSGTGVSLTAAANTHYDFSSWSGGCSGARSPCALNLTRDTTVGANFSAATAYGTDSIYLLASAKPDKPTGGTRASHHLPPGGWTRTLPTPTLQQPVYRTQRTVTYIGGVFSRASAWGDVKKHKYREEEQGHLYKKTANRPDPPSGGTRNANHRPSGWKTTPDQPTLTESVWRTQRTVTYEYTLRSYRDTYSKSFRSATVWGGVVKYSYPHPREEKDYVYKRSATEPTAPTGGTKKVEHTPSGWLRSSPEPTRTEPVWRAQRTLFDKYTLKDDGSGHDKGPFHLATSWGGVVKHSYLHPREEKDYVYKRSATEPTAPTGGTKKVEHTPSGWLRSSPEPTRTEPVWRAQRTLFDKYTLKDDGSGHDKGPFHSATSWGGVVKHSYLHPREEKDYVYKRSATEPTAPTGGTKKVEHTPSGWLRSSPEPTRTEPVWRAQRTLFDKYTLKDDGSGHDKGPFHLATSWGGVVKHSYLHPREEKDYVYKRSATEPTAPTGGTKKVEHTPSGWLRSSPEPTRTEPVWRAQRTLFDKYTLKDDGSGHDKGPFHLATSWGGVVKHSYLHPREEKDYVYKRSATEPTAPTGGTKKVEHTPSGWLRSSPEPTRTEPVWRAQRTLFDKYTLKDDGSGHDKGPFRLATSWGGVVKFGHADLDYIYTQAHSIPTAPTGGETSKTHTPTNWQRLRVFVRTGVPVFQAGRTRYYENGSFERASSWGGITELVSVNAGGPYWADQAWGRSYYSATVQATARGGATPYAYRWEGKRTDGRSATYLFHRSGFYDKSVTVTDAGSDTATDTATITTRGQLRLGGASDDFAHDVSLGGVLIFVWGGEGSVSAVSENAGVAAVAVNEDEIAVSGISAGRTEITVRTGVSEFRVPFRVGED